MLRKAILIVLLISAILSVNCARRAEVDVTMKDFAYSPREITINVGDKVTWINNDIEPHTITTLDWDSGVIEPGSRYTRSFDTIGTFEVHCQFHPDMVGQVTVISPRSTLY